ncbi:2OG-Fe(II) oxygenase superfamily protein [mine drainage metagenome]|uniref:2OG-Fe(II) oxygenase superfamily protein n=1 Tax=mine drainage metagenome TaxID=410659 RepID=A0A1J5PKE2_9ZZZZ
MLTELQQWASEQFARGCRSEDMLQTLLDAGHSTSVANRVVWGELDDSTSGSAMGGEEFLNCENLNAHHLLSMQEPCIHLFQNILSSEECDTLIELARARLVNSLVLDPDSGMFREDSGRLSHCAHFRKADDPLVDTLQKRIELILGHRLESQEPLQIVRYSVGGEYTAHYDYFDPDLPGSENILKNGGQRIATCIFYLNTVKAGGGTVFPKAKWLRARAIQGNAVYFRNVKSDGRVDTETLHAGEPVTEGEKWLAVQWIRSEKYGE